MKKKNGNSGFTLVEMLIAATIFSVVVVIIASVFTSALKEQRSAFDVQQLEENITYILERMAKEIRVSEITGPLEDCSSVGPSSFLFIHHPDGYYVKYFLDTTTKQAYRNATVESTGTTVSAVLNSNLVEVTDFKFCVSGQSSTDNYQPRVTIFGAIRPKGSEKVDRFQTTISLRKVQE